MARVESLEKGEGGVKEADLKGSLSNGTPALYEDEEDVKDSHANLSEETLEDYQLLRAIDLLRGVALYNSNQPMTAANDNQEETDGESDAEE